VQSAVQDLGAPNYEWSHVSPQGLFDIEYLKRIVLMCEGYGSVSSHSVHKTVQLIDALKGRMVRQSNCEVERQAEEV
jgi:hypothetical protein